jgi:hypothetical protein
MKFPLYVQQHRLYYDSNTRTLYNMDGSEFDLCLPDEVWYEAIKHINTILKERGYPAHDYVKPRIIVQVPSEIRERIEERCSA